MSAVKRVELVTNISSGILFLARMPQLKIKVWKCRTLLKGG
jgi:hypothetical protein